MRPYFAWASATVFVIDSRSDVTSSTKASAPASLRAVNLLRLRPVARTRWPFFKALRAISLPKPLEAAVMNQTGEDILG